LRSRVTRKTAFPLSTSAPSLVPGSLLGSHAAWSRSGSPLAHCNCADLKSRGSRAMTVPDAISSLQSPTLLCPTTRSALTRLAACLLEFPTLLARALHPRSPLPPHRCLAQPLPLPPAPLHNPRHYRIYIVLCLGPLLTILRVCSPLSSNID
jgi:hypothetical protein